MMLAGFPAANVLYWPELKKAGVLPVNADSIGLPIFSSVILAFLLSPLVLGVTWLCLRRSNPAARPKIWRNDLPFASALSLLIFGGAAAFLAAGELMGNYFGQPWYEYLWPAHSLLCIAGLLALHTAVMKRMSQGGRGLSPPFSPPASRFPTVIKPIG